MRNTAASFYIGMVTRNERNAIIQHGTMTMVRKSVLEEVGGWAEWCITEDAELGLRIFEKGYEATLYRQQLWPGPDAGHLYRFQETAVSLGLRCRADHAPSRRTLLRKRKSRLTYGQRYHFIAGWLPWMADSINLLFTLAALAWSLAMIHYPAQDRSAPDHPVVRAPGIFRLQDGKDVLSLPQQGEGNCPPDAWLRPWRAFPCPIPLPRPSCSVLSPRTCPFSELPKKVRGRFLVCPAVSPGGRTDHGRLCFSRHMHVVLRAGF